MRHSSGFRPSLLLLALVFSVTTVHAAPLGTAFTHKGEYKPGGTAVTGIYDFQIVLFNVATVGTAISTVTRDNVVVTQGNFTVEIDYTAAPFATATQYWLETRVRAGTSTGAFTVVPVRQKLNAKSAKLEAENTAIKARVAALEKQTATHARTQTRLEALEARFERMFQARAE